MKIGAQFLAEDFEACMESVQVAEGTGYAHAWFSDSKTLWQDCYVYIPPRSLGRRRSCTGPPSRTGSPGIRQ